MERRQLEYFLAVVDSGGFVRAAMALRVAQPSLSHGVATLERECGVQLFHRLARGVRLTAAGEALIEPARQVLRDLATAHSAVLEVAGLTAGALDIVSLTTLAVDPLAGIVGVFRQRYPRVDIRVADPPTVDAIPQLVRAGQYELGLTDAVSGLEGLSALELRPQEILLVLPPSTAIRDGPIPLADVAGMPLVAAPQGSSTRELVDSSIAARAAPPRLAVEIAHWAAIVPLVLAGAGPALLPSPLAQEAALRGAVIRPLDPPLTRPVRLVWRSAPVSPPVSALLDLTRELDLTRKPAPCAVPAP